MDSTTAACAALEDSLRQIVALHGALPAQPLAVAERRELGGHLFPQGPGLVLMVGRALVADPEVFEGVDADGAALLARQRLASRFLMLRDGLLAMAQLAGDGFLRAQSVATKEAQRVVRLVKAAPAGGDGRGDGRRLLLVSAYLLIDRYQRSLLRRKEQRRQQRPTAPAPQPSAAQHRAARAARQERLAGFEARFSDHALRPPAAPASLAAAHAPAPAAAHAAPLPSIASASSRPGHPPPGAATEPSSVDVAALLAALPPQARAALRRLLL